MSCMVSRKRASQPFKEEKSSKDVMAGVGLLGLILKGFGGLRLSEGLGVQLAILRIW